MRYDAVIVGAGAAGLMCAIEAGKRGRKVLLIDHAKAVGEKIRISGGGRCNFTNIHTTPAHYLSNNKYFCVSALKRYPPAHFIALVEKHGIAYHEKTLGQLFCDDSAKQIIQMLLDECADAKVEIRLQCTVSAIEKSSEGYRLTLSDDQLIETTSLVIATGGPSIPKMGATGWGYEVAKQFGLNMVEPRAALVPFTLDEDQLARQKELAGVSLPVTARCNGISFTEGMLFTHKGLSGPSILQISSYWNEGDLVQLNLLPQMDVFAHLKQLKQSNPKQEVQTALAQLLPKKLVQFLCEEFSIGGTLADASHNFLHMVADRVGAWKVTPNGTEGYRTAEVVRGGVDTDALSSKTMECKNHAGLYFIGEVVDVTGHLGGFNFQWAWASGHAAGQVV